MKVLLVTPYGGVPGGISRWAGHLMKYYDEFGRKDCEVTLVPMGRSSFVNINSPKLYRLKEAVKDYSKIIKDYKQKLNASSYDVMHLTSSASWSLLKDIYLIKVARRKGVRTVIHFRFGRIPQLSQTKNWEWKLITKVLKLVDCAIVLDKKSLDTLHDLGYKNIICLPNPVSPQVQTIVSKNKVARVPRYILYCGHVVKTKGVFELIDACSQIPNIKLKFVGHVTDEMRAEINEYSNSAPWLELAGEMPYEEVIKEMMASDIMTLPSYTEGFPNVILEGMAAGCALVVTDVGAMPQMLEEENGEKYGIIIKPQDAKGLEQAINYLFEHSDEKEAMRNRVKNRVQERYSMKKSWESLLGLWSNLSNQ